VASVAVTSVALNKSAAVVWIGGQEQLTAAIQPSNAANKNVNWSSSDTNVATVAGGLVTAKSAGTANIAVTTQDGNKTDTCAVTVIAPTTLSAGEDHTLAVRAAGTLWAWGSNTYGQLGNGTNTYRNSPAQVGSANDWRAVWAGYLTSFAIKTNGTLWAWGYNGRTQLGLGDTTDRNVPVQVSSDKDWRIITSGYHATCAIRANGSLSYYNNAWWSSYDDQQGWDLKAVSVGFNHGIALKTDGSLWAWGFNYSGQFGNGTTSGHYSSYNIQAGEVGWAAVSAGGRCTVALKTDGSLWAWGSNDYGQLGLGDATDRNVPVQVDSTKDWKDVSVGDYHTVALRTDGSLWAWGRNDWHQLGNGTYTDKNIPVRVDTAQNWAAVSAGGSHTVALKTDGSLWAWGANYSGQLGDGTDVSRAIPVQVAGGGVYATAAEHAAGLQAAEMPSYENALPLNPVPSAEHPRYTYSANSTHISASGDIYEAGWGYNGDGRSMARLWKNGEEQPLEIGQDAIESRAHSVYASGTDVYVAGYVHDGQVCRAALWVNGIAIMLGDDSHDSSAEYLYASLSGDIYVVGHECDAQGISVPTLWIVSANGSVETIRLDGATVGEIVGGPRIEPASSTLFK
jgi:alpha-tubulin suppressor-like RCC1 family protein